MQDCSSGRLPRHSDGGAGIPPATPRNGKKASKQRRKGLQTSSVPLTPQAGLHGPLDPRDAAQQLPNVPAAGVASPSRLSRRSTQSDTGQTQQLPPPERRSSKDRKTSTSSNRSSTVQQQQGNSNLTGSATGHQVQTGGKGVKLQPLQPTQQLPQQQPAAPPTPVPAVAARALQHAASLEAASPAPPPSLWEFFYAEATPHEKYPTTDVLWRQTERDRVYNFLLYVPYQLERIMIFGTLLCFYSFLGALTALPLRCLRALWQLLTRIALPSRRQYSSLATSSSSGGSCSSSSRRPSLLPGAQLYDLLCVLLMLGAVAVLAQIKPGVIYYWMKDITSEFLKIQVLFTALEICDKILSNFGVDVLEALSGTCTLFTQSSIGLMQLLSDLLVAFLLITAHGGVLMCQAMVFAVTMNSKRNALLALMIATNFVELKGQVYKRTDTNKLWTLACQDIVERFQLLLVLLFVVVEDISNSGTWWPAPTTLLECGRIFLWEVVIDISKHAVLGKFNDIRPGIYREYMRDLCTDSLDNHSHNIHKLVGFCPMGPAALCLRMVHTLFTLKCEGRPDWHLRSAVLLGLWLAACATQVVLGFSLKWLAYLYVRHHTLQAGGKVLPRAINVSPAGIKLLPSSAAAAAPKAAAASSIGLGNPTPSSGGTTQPPSSHPAASGGVGAGNTTPRGVAAAPATGSLSAGLPCLSPGSLQSKVAAAAVSGCGPLSGLSPAHSPGKASSALNTAGILPLPSGAFGGLGSSSSASAAASALSLQARGGSSSSAMSAADRSGSGSAFLSATSSAAQPAHHSDDGRCGGSGSTSSSSSDSSYISSSSRPPNAAAAALAASIAAAGAAAAGGTGSSSSAPQQQLVAATHGPNGSSAHWVGASPLGLVQRAGSTPDSPFSSASQLSSFTVLTDGKAADARASFSDARPGWEQAAVDADACALGSLPHLAPIRISAESVGGQPPPSSELADAAAVGPSSLVKPRKAASANARFSSGYSGLSAAGITGRSFEKSSSLSDVGRTEEQQQQVDEQDWQQPRGRHRAKRE